MDFGFERTSKRFSERRFRTTSSFNVPTETRIDIGFPRAEGSMRNTRPSSQCFMDDPQFAKFMMTKLDEQRLHLYSLVSEVCTKEAQMVSQLLTEYERTPKRDVVDLILDATFADNAMQGLVGWIPDSELRSEAMEMVFEMQAALETKNGNALRTIFDHLLHFYMAILHVADVLEDLYQGGHLAQRISKNLRNYLKVLQRFKSDSSSIGSSSSSSSSSSSPTSVSGLNNGAPDASLNPEAQRLVGACFTIVNIGNWASHNLDQLSFFKILEVCGAIGALSETLPSVYGTFKMLEQDRQDKIDRERAVAAERERKRREQFANLQVTKATTPWALTASTPADPDFPALRAAVPNPTIQSYAHILTVKQPSVQAEPKPIYKFFYRFDTVPSPESLLGLTKSQFARMVAHMEHVPKANLCMCLNPGCDRSHSYKEVMKFNPLFKRIKCVTPAHYCGRDIREDVRCAGVHVDTGVSWNWMDTDKKKLCDRMNRCSYGSSCKKSHSVAEVCWYNPSFRTQACTSCRLGCAKYHNTLEQRTQDTDFVGVAHEMLFPERTHHELARLLQDLEDSQ